MNLKQFIKLSNLTRDKKPTLKKIAKWLKRKGFIRGWIIKNYIFAQDAGEDGYFFKVKKNKLEDVYGYPKLYFDKEYKELQGCDFMEKGDHFYDTPSF